MDGPLIIVNRTVSVAEQPIESVIVTTYVYVPPVFGFAIGLAIFVDNKFAPAGLAVHE